MKRLPFTALALLLPFLAQAEKPLKLAWELTEDITAPESAYLDAGTGFLYLSQIGGGGGKAKDGDGRISKLRPDGTMVKADWATGLNAPKGLRSANGQLWVSDIDRVVAFDLKNGKQVQEIVIEGSQFLNDVAAGPDGAIYVSDMPASTIYRIVDGKAEVFANGQHLDSPNGLLIDGGRLLIAGWGKELDDTFTGKTTGRLLSLDLETRKVTPITTTPTGNLDGLPVYYYLETDGSGFEATLMLYYGEDTALIAAGIPLEQEGNLRAYRYLGNNLWEPRSSSVDQANNILTVHGVTQFSVWGIGVEDSHPTEVSASTVIATTTIWYPVFSMLLLGVVVIHVRRKCRV